MQMRFVEDAKHDIQSLVSEKDCTSRRPCEYSSRGECSLCTSPRLCNTTRFIASDAIRFVYTRCSRCNREMTCLQRNSPPPAASTTTSASSSGAAEMSAHDAAVNEDIHILDQLWSIVESDGKASHDDLGPAEPVVIDETAKSISCQPMDTSGGDVKVAVEQEGDVTGGQAMECTQHVENDVVLDESAPTAAGSSGIQGGGNSMQGGGSDVEMKYMNSSPLSPEKCDAGSPDDSLSPETVEMLDEATTSSTENSTETSSVPASSPAVESISTPTTETSASQQSVVETLTCQTLATSPSQIASTSSSCRSILSCQAAGPSSCVTAGTSPRNTADTSSGQVEGDKSPLLNVEAQQPGTGGLVNEELGVQSAMFHSSTPHAPGGLCHLSQQASLHLEDEPQPDDSYLGVNNCVQIMAVDMALGDNRRNDHGQDEQGPGAEEKNNKEEEEEDDEADREGERLSRLNRAVVSRATKDKARRARKAHKARRRAERSRQSFKRLPPLCTGCRDYEDGDDYGDDGDDGMQHDGGFEAASTPAHHTVYEYADGETGANNAAMVAARCRELISNPGVYFLGDIARMTQIKAVSLHCVYCCLVSRPSIVMCSVLVYNEFGLI